MRRKKKKKKRLKSGGRKNERPKWKRETQESVHPICFIDQSDPDPTFKETFTDHQQNHLQTAISKYNSFILDKFEYENESRNILVPQSLVSKLVG